MSLSAATSSPSWWLYLLGCEDGRTYAGIALNVDERFKQHCQGRGAKFTRSNPPIAILGVRAFETKSAALKAEYALRILDRESKLKWAKENPPLFEQTLPRVTA